MSSSRIVIPLLAIILLSSLVYGRLDDELVFDLLWSIKVLNLDNFSLQGSKMQYTL